MEDSTLRRRLELLEDEFRHFSRRLEQLRSELDGPKTADLEEQKEDPVEAIVPDPIQLIEEIPEPPTLPPQKPLVLEPTGAVAQIEAAASRAETERINTELVIGQVWAVRIGVLLLFTGFVFLANYAWENFVTPLGAGARLATLTLTAFAGLVAGEIIRRKPRLGTFGEVIAGGGLAALYYCAYAAHHTERLRVIEQASLGALLLTLTGLAILAFGVWRRASVMCSIALLLSFFGSSIQPVAATSMISAFIVATFGAVLCVRFQWKSLGVVGLLGAYLAHIIWQGSIHSAAAFSLSSWFLVCYWLLYSGVALVPRNLWSDRSAVMICALNHGLLATFLPFDWSLFAWDSRAWMAHAALAVIVLIFWRGLEKFRGPSRLSEAHLVQGIGLLTLAALTKWSGHELSLVLSLKGAVLLGWDRWRTRFSVEFCGWALILLSLAIAFVNQPLLIPGPQWLLFSGILFSALSLARRSHFPKNDSPELQIDLFTRPAIRFVVAACTVLALFFGLLNRFPDLGWTPWMVGISLVITGLDRFMKEHFPAPEVVSLLSLAAIITMIPLAASHVLESSHSIATLTLCVLGMAHAIVHPPQNFTWNALSERDLRGILLALGAWFLIGLYGLNEKPFDPWTPVAAVMLLTLIQGLANHLKWHVLRRLSPVFALAILAMAINSTLFAPPTLPLYLTFFSLLAYAAWLSLSGSKHALIIPLGVATLGLIWIFVQESFGSLALLSLALAFSFTPLAERKTWRIAILVWVLVSFLIYLNDPANRLLTYLFPAVGFAFLAYRARIQGKSSELWTKLAAVIISISLVLKISTWVGLEGAGHELTITWAVLAAFFFALGFAIRESIMRLMMLLLLLASMAKILASVWQLGTLMRIVSFLVTGGIFLLLGYFYNKHPEWFGRSDEPSKPDRTD